MPRTTSTSATAKSNRVYTWRDQTVDGAFAHAVELRLVSETASNSDKLHALVAYADKHLVEERERKEKIAAYTELATDNERREAIYAANLQALEDGIL